MKHSVWNLACLALVVALPAFAQDQERSANRQQQGQQTIRGTVAGVTTIGEAVIDPATNTAVAVQVNYLTVLGSPARGENQSGAQRNSEDQANSNEQNRQANRSRQNLYLVAISPQTQIRVGDQGRGPREETNKATSQAKNQHQAQSAFDQLEIGDRVTIQFKSTGRLNQTSNTKESENQKTAEKSDDADKPKEQTTGFRGDSKSKHGRNRIFIGEASSITIMSAGSEQDRRQGSERGQTDRNQRDGNRSGSTNE